jgi:hypothetical protein
MTVFIEYPIPPLSSELHAGGEFGHVHGNGLLDVKLTRERAAGIVASGKAEPHHFFGPSAWISFQLRTPVDCGPALVVGRAALPTDKRQNTPAARTEELEHPTSRNDGLFCQSPSP